MAAVYLAVSRPGDYTKEGLIVGNPEAQANIASGSLAASPSWGTSQIDMAVGARRLLSVVADREIEVLQLSATETTSSFNGVPTRVPVPAGAMASYACLVHPATVAIYVRTP